MLGKAIKEYIDDHGLKQTKVAENAGMKVQTLNDILNCRRKVEATEYFAICRALGVPVSYFEDLLQNESA